MDIRSELLNTNNMIAQEEGTPPALIQAYNKYYQPFIQEQALRNAGLSHTKLAAEFKKMSPEYFAKQLKKEVKKCQ